ncbi:fibronectin type III domain-containing protein [Paraflavitalea pollutisoli]|uniref:fibronectin type III domain-containing protein n=1 Tax=Paraflavitalea pollutisoli TaxID=3034143 RepID=UPI0023EBAF02|nr:fibronectin type III domain-containing protein [Paraflavitalea sp. H1-2-19X]
MKRLLLLTTTTVLLCLAMQAQNVFNPDDPIVRWNSAATLGTSTNPNPNIGGLQKWVSVASNGISTGSGNWDNTSFKAYYINIGGQSFCFRLKFPKNYKTDDVNKKYPVMLFFHGAGEPGCPSNGGIYNNERQLTHGAKFFRDKVDNQTFDGFLLYPQALTTGTCNSSWGSYTPVYNVILNLLDSMNKYVRSDIDRVFVNGLSNGGSAAWHMAFAKNDRIAAAGPSAAAIGGENNLNNLVHIPIWFASGGKDSNPNQSIAQGVYNDIKALGSDIKYTLYPDLGHSIWTNHWSEPGYIEFMSAHHKANPLIFFQRDAWCVDAAISAKLGITNNNSWSYEWQRNGVTIAQKINGVVTIQNAGVVKGYSANVNEITVDSFGTYQVRFKRTNGGAWSVWSPKPAVIKPKPITQTPTPAVLGLQSNVLPSPDGKSTVTLSLPAGYISYQWLQGATVKGNQPTYNASVGTYTASVVEQFGCGALPSAPFTVLNANGNPKPDPAKNLSAHTLSLTSVQLDWTDNPNAIENETGYEVYRAATAGGPYKLIAITPANATSYVNTNLTPNTSFYYIVRAIGASGAAAVTSEVSVKTDADNTAPTAPSNLTLTGAFTDYANISWIASTDDVGVAKYDVFVNGAKMYTTDQTTLTIANLDSGVVYNIIVKARDAAGNFSQPSNQVTASTGLIGNNINFKYFEGSWSNLPNFDNLFPVKTGSTPNITVTPRNQADYFGFLWEGYINVPTTANYTFEICSDDGSRLYVDQTYGFAKTPLINNDGGHGNQCKTATIALTAGLHPIALGYFDGAGSDAVSWSWQNDAGLAKQAIPSNVLFAAGAVGSTMTAPSKLVATTVSHNKINLTWTDNSANETGFEIVRSTTSNGTYSQVATVGADITNFTDSGLLANTKYFYKVRTIGNSNASNYTGTYTEANWKLNNSNVDSNGNATRYLTLTNATYSTTGPKEGTHALNMTGSNQYATINGAASGGFPSEGAYTQRTVGIWLKSTALTNNKVIFDFGNSTNGLALRFSGGLLQAGIASASNRLTLAPTATAFNANWVTGGWNHVTVVYNVSSLKIFLNGVEIAANNALPFSTIAAAASNNARFGYSGNTNGESAFNAAATSNDYFNGQMDDIYVINGALTLDEIASLVSLTYKQAAATTQPTPATPATPTNLAGTAVSSSVINLTWTDNASNETGYEVSRSATSGVGYFVIGTVPANTTAFSDTGLVANVTYYYKVRANGPAASSGYSSELSVTSLNNAPKFTPQSNFTVRYNSVHVLTVKATDADGDAMTFTTGTLPSFVTVQNITANGLELRSAPGISAQGSYMLRVYVTDVFGGKDTLKYNMVVNDNSLPVITAVPAVNLSEMDTRVVALEASDDDGNNTLTWSVVEKPSFVTLVDSGNGRGSITLKPTLADAGSYTITVKSDDSFGGFETKSITVTVADKEAKERIQINMKNTTSGGTGWNDVVATYGGAITLSDLKNVKGVNTGASFSFLSNEYGTASAGVQGGGAWPNSVMVDGIYWGYGFQGGTKNDTLRVRLNGLDVARKYNVIFMASNNCGGCGNEVTSKTTFKIGNETADILFYNNANTTDTIYQVQPGAGGEVLISMIGDANPAVGGTLNFLVLEAAFDDSTVPAKPTNLVAAAEPAGVKLTWVDKAYNENNYQVFRANVKAGPYTLLTTLAADVTTYTDAAVTPFSQYFYYVVANNNYGTGAGIDTASATTANNKPVVAGVIATHTLKVDDVVNDDFTVTDPGDVVTVSIVDKPGFVTLQQLGGTNYRLIVAPSASDLGTFNFTVKAADDKGGETTVPVTVTVNDKNTRSVLVNFAYWGDEAAAPWNNIVGYIGAEYTLPNLKDENNATTPFSITTVGGWNPWNNGHNSGSNTGVYNDKVIKSGHVINDSLRVMRFSNLDNSKRYNVVIFASSNDGRHTYARYTSGATSDTLNASYNTNRTANLNNLQPVGGVIEFSLRKFPASDYLFINAVQLEEFTAGLNLNPVNLSSEPVDRNSVYLIWSDRTNNEDAAGGFQVERSTDAAFSSTVAFNLPSNTTEYKVTGLNPNTKYWFRVRAKVGGVYTDWSNVTKTITPQAITYVNFNFGTEYNAPAPWYNLAALPSEPFTFPNLPNQSKQPTGMTLAWERFMNADNNFGVITGNNSGFAPDVVLRSNYWIDNTQLAQMRLSGLNQSKRYRIGFFGSMSTNGWWEGNYTSTYTVNGKTVYLNSWMNSVKVVYIGDLQPDANGELMLNFSTTQEAAYGFNGGLIIQAYEDGAAGGTVLNRTEVETTGAEQPTVATNEATSPAAAAAATRTIAEGRMYPNPFVDQINLDFNNTAANNHVTVDVFDLSGKLMFRKDFGKLAAGYSTLRVNTAAANLNTGLYMVTLNVNGKPVHVSKLVKASK